MRQFTFLTVGILIPIIALTIYTRVPAAPIQVEPVSVASQVNASSNDAEEAISGGSMDLTSSDLELGADGSTLQYAAMRFNNIAIPQGASILNAYVEFEVDETGSDPTSVLIKGQATDNAPAFTAANGNISSRARTNAQVAWNNIPPWTTLNAKWQTPNLAPIIQEIVSRSGWASGNSIAIILSGSGRRTAEAYDGEIPAAPRLVIQYATGDTPTPDPNAKLTPTSPQQTRQHQPQGSAHR